MEKFSKGQNWKNLILQVDDRRRTVVFKKTFEVDDLLPQNFFQAYVVLSYKHNLNKVVKII